MAYIGRGAKLYGYCNGYFGRDSYGTKIIREAGVIGTTFYIVAEENERPVFASGMTFEDAERWTTEENDEDWELPPLAPEGPVVPDEDLPPLAQMPDNMRWMNDDA